MSDREIAGRFTTALDIIINGGLIRGRKTFCDRYGISRGSLYNAEHVTFRVSPVWLYYLAADFGLSSDWLLTGRGLP